MPKTVKEAMEHGQALINDYASQKAMMDRMDEMYFMDWNGEKPDEEKMKFTPSPTPRNALIGAIRLMTSTEPIFSVPYDSNDDTAKGVSEEIERLCRSIWFHSGRFKGVPLEQEAIASLLRYGMMVLSITNTTELYEEYKKRGMSKAEVKMMEKVVNTTPYLIEAWDPKGVYPEWGRFGLSAVYRTVNMTVAEAKGQFGKEALYDVINKSGSTDNDIVTYADYWDLDKHMAWVSSVNNGGEVALCGEPIADEEHELPCIPIVVQRGEGSLMDADRERQALPFLYAADKGKLWERQNLELSYLYTNLFYLAANPTFIYESNREDGLDFDNSVPGKVVKIRSGEKFGQLQKEVVNNDMMAGLRIADELLEESTIFSQALGGMGQMGANASFSAISLLHQAGRLPLSTPQSRGAWAIGDCMEKIIDIMRDRREKGKAKGKNGQAFDFDASELPESLIIEVKLDVDLPQDMVAQAQIATSVMSQGLASKRWIQENILNIGQAELMNKEIWNEQAAEFMYQDLVTRLRKAGLQMPGMSQGMPQDGPPQGGPMPGANPTMMGATIPGEQPMALGEEGKLPNA